MSVAEDPSPWQDWARAGFKKHLLGDQPIPHCSFHANVAGPDNLKMFILLNYIDL